MIDINFTIRRVEVSDISATYQLLLAVTGDFSVRVGDKMLYFEQELPLVEFAVQAARWLRRGPRVEDDFIYESMEAQEPGLIWVRHSERGWKIGAIHQSYEERSQFSWEEIADALATYVQTLQRDLSVLHGLDIEELVLGRMRP